MSTIKSLRLDRVGQIVCADVRLADLTVLVGPQATGKSIFLQFLKLVLDTGSTGHGRVASRAPSGAMKDSAPIRRQ